jgi:16S rRNA (uracil1498-N3)-methyltransferase
MSLPVFYYPQQLFVGSLVSLEGDTAQHLHVLRTQIGEQLQLTDGNGNLATAVVKNSAKKKFDVHITQTEQLEKKTTPFHLAVAFTKNASRNEWLLEKATELGVSSIQPIISKRSEKVHFKEERWSNILVSAMLQSQQCHLPRLATPLSFEKIIAAYQFVPQKIIAHCEPSIERLPLHQAVKPQTETIFFIGPEGDFTKEEIQQAMNEKMLSIQLGNTRLRTETAAMAVLAFFKMLHS